MKARGVFPALVVSVAILGVLSGCAGSTGGGTTTSTTTGVTLAPTTTSTAAPETTTTTAARLGWGDTGTWQGISITAAAPQTDSMPESVGPGDKVVYCLVKMVNNAKDPFDYNGLKFMLFDTAHQEYDNFGLTSMPDLGEGTLAPGESVEGAVAFELPEAATPSGLEWQSEASSAPQLIWGEP